VYKKKIRCLSNEALRRLIVIAHDEISERRNMFQSERKKTKVTAEKKSHHEVL
jgi:hypothetical protein